MGGLLISIACLPALFHPIFRVGINKSQRREFNNQNYSARSTIVISSGHAFIFSVRRFHNQPNWGGLFLGYLYLASLPISHFLSTTQQHHSHHPNDNPTDHHHTKATNKTTDHRQTQQTTIKPATEKTCPPKQTRFQKIPTTPKTPTTTPLTTTPLTTTSTTIPTTPTTTKPTTKQAAKKKPKKKQKRTHPQTQTDHKQTDHSRRHPRRHSRRHSRRQPPTTTPTTTLDDNPDDNPRQHPEGTRPAVPHTWQSATHTASVPGLLPPQPTSAMPASAAFAGRKPRRAERPSSRHKRQPPDCLAHTVPGQAQWNGVGGLASWTRLHSSVSLAGRPSNLCRGTGDRALGTLEKPSPSVCRLLTGFLLVFLPFPPFTHWLTWPPSIYQGTLIGSFHSCLVCFRLTA